MNRPVGLSSPLKSQAITDVKLISVTAPFTSGSAFHSSLHIFAILFPFLQILFYTL